LDVFWFGRLCAKELGMFVVKLLATGAAAFGGAVLVGVIAMSGRELRRAGDDLVVIRRAVDSMRVALGGTMPARGFVAGRPGAVTPDIPAAMAPSLDPSAFVDPLASVVGYVQLGKDVFVAPLASVRGDAAGQPIAVGEGSNIQDGAVVQALETVDEGKPIPGRTFKVGTREYSVYIGKRVSLAPQALVHGPAQLDDNVYVGMQALVFQSRISAGVVIEPGARVIGVTIPPNRYVPAGQTVSEQNAADRLPAITDTYRFKGMGEAAVRVNTGLARGYLRALREAEAVRAKPPTVEGVVAANDGPPAAAASH